MNLALGYLAAHPLFSWPSIVTIDFRQEESTKVILTQAIFHNFTILLTTLLYLFGAIVDFMKKQLINTLIQPSITKLRCAKSISFPIYYLLINVFPMKT